MLNLECVFRGIIIYVRKTLYASPSQLVPDFSESVWCEIPLEKKDRLLLGCTYRSPNSTEDNFLTSGIPQGSVLGPILFVLFINDLPDDILSSIVMFADDTKLWSKVNNTEDRAALQFDIDKLATWSNDWQLSFNADKCKSLHLGHNNHEYQYSMPSTVTRKPIEKTNLEKDLGVNIDVQLKFSKHIEIQVNKANKILGMIRRSYEFLDGDSLKILFIALVRPHLEYSNAVWSPRYIKDKKLMERVQRRATKLIPDLKELPYETRLKKLQLPSLYYRRARGDMIEVYKYMYNIYDVDTSRLLDRDQDSYQRTSIQVKESILQERNKTCLFQPQRGRYLEWASRESSNSTFVK